MASFVHPVLAMLAALLGGLSAASDPEADPYFPVFHVRPPEAWWPSGALYSFFFFGSGFPL